MQTIYDWLTVGSFAGLIVLFLSRSVADEPSDTVWQYLPPAAGCAVANFVGNAGNGALAVIIICASAAYVYYILKPGERH